MLQLCGGLDLAQEPFPAYGGGEVRMQNLDRDITFVAEIMGEVHRGHATLPELTFEPVAVGEHGAEPRERIAHFVVPLPPRSFAISAGRFWMMTIRAAWLKPTIAKVWPSGETS